MNQKYHYMQWVAPCASKSPFLSFQHLVLRYCVHWWIAASRYVKFWGCRYSVWRMLCNYSLAGFDVNHIRRNGRPVFRMYIYKDSV